MARLALFDLDNTLIDRDGAFRLWAQRFLRARGLSDGAGGASNSALAWVLEADGGGFRPREDFFAAVRDRFDLPEEPAALAQAYEDQMAEMYRPEPDVLGALAGLRSAGWKTAVVTNGPPTQETKIRAAGLDAVLDAWCISALVGAPKPERAIFEAAATRCGAALDGWMVGDTPEPDILGGIRAGLRTVWMARGRRWTVSDYAPDVIVDDVTQAAATILASEPAGPSSG